MEFGRVPEEELDKIDFKLPPEPAYSINKSWKESRSKL